LSTPEQNSPRFSPSGTTKTKLRPVAPALRPKAQRLVLRYGKMRGIELANCLPWERRAQGEPTFDASERHGGAVVACGRRQAQEG
jgi:hypothetical protein